MTEKDYATKLKYKMSRIKSRETKPEILVRSLLHRMGFRFRKNVERFPGKPDIVLKKYKTIIFVHGCFWHQHKGCKKCKIPKSNIDFWTEKLTKNVLRDRLHNKALKSLGWKVYTIWECQVFQRKKLERRIERLFRVRGPD